MTVSVAADTPSAGTVAGDAAIHDLEADTAGTSKLTWVVAVRARLLSDVSTALNVTVSTVGSLTVNVATPLDPVVCELGVITAVVDEELKSTVLPPTGLVPSSRVTSTVPDVCVTLLVEVATIGVVVVTVESAAETTRVPNVTLTLWPVRATLSVVSVAVVGHGLGIARRTP